MNGKQGNQVTPVLSVERGQTGEPDIVWISDRIVESG